MATLGGGKWQRRIIESLRDAHGPLTTRQLRIRCGMLRHMDPTGSAMRNTLMTLAKGQYLQRLAPGCFALTQKGQSI